MTVPRRILYPDGHFVLGGHLWAIGRPGWCPSEKTGVYVEVHPDFPENATLYSDPKFQHRVGIATRGVKLSSQ